MGWIRKRMQERSTKSGMVLLSMALGLWLGPVQADIVVQSVAALWGVYEAVRPEGVGQ